MPLAAGNSRAVISSNIREMMASGHPQDQSVAAALSNARRHPRGFGGHVTGLASGGLARRGGDGDWTDNLERVRPLHEMVDPGIYAFPQAGIDRRMEHVFTPDVYQDVTRPRGSFAVGGVPHFDDGGMVPQIGGPAPSAATANPNTQSLIQRFSAMSPEQLQETTIRLRGSPLGSLAQRVLQQKRIMPQPGQTPQMGGMAAPVSPVSQAPLPQVPGGQQGFAFGGAIGMSEADPWWTRREADSGFLHSTVPGRTDHIAASPAADSFVIPADVVAGVGEGNSLAGAHILQLALGTGPHGIPLPRGGGGSRMPRPPSLSMMRALENESRGGRTKKVDIMAAGGEFILTPEQVAAIGHGDVARGHKRLEAWVVHQRKKNIEDQKRLKGPVKS